MTREPVKSYAHMCRDGHTQIGHNDSSDDERCPLCRALADSERLKAELARIRGLPRLAALDAEIEWLRALLRRHQVCAWCEEDSDLTVETRAAIGDAKP
jgi:uncharacterized small protein (DUF1192 family)